jgi:hypothetical protein
VSKIKGLCTHKIGSRIVFKHRTSIQGFVRRYQWTTVEELH